jgi:endonuclease/exonuclease/phosphatase (EEP) superfamily protein YafD
LEAYLQTVQGPLVVTGDFNATPGMRTMQQFGSACQLTDLHARTPAVTHFTYAVENDKPGKRIDYLWHRGMDDAQPLEVFAGFPDRRGHLAARQLIETVGSDHHFVVGRFAAPCAGRGAAIATAAVAASVAALP